MHKQVYACHPQIIAPFSTASKNRVYFGNNRIWQKKKTVGARKKNAPARGVFLSRNKTKKY
jgi:hypothetical protein